MSSTIGAPVSLDYLTPCCLSSLCSSHWPRDDPSTLAQPAGITGVLRASLYPAEVYHGSVRLAAGCSGQHRPPARQIP